MRYKGVFTALITPMQGDEVDSASMQRLVDAQLEAGIHGLVVNGTTAEAATLTSDEQVAMVELVMERVEGRVPVIAGVGTNVTRTTVERARRMEGLGVDGLLVVTPYYNRPSQAGLAAHFREVASAVSPSTSICLYNVPSRTAISMEPDTIESLAVLPNVDAIKEATTDMVRAARVIAAAGSNAAVLAGDDAAFLPMMALGASGIVSAAANVMPGPFVQLHKTYRWGDIDDARELAERYLAPILSLFKIVNPVGVKAACQLAGLIDSDAVRLPLVNATDAEKDALRGALTNGGLLD